MPWVRLDDGFPDHPKVVAAGPLAGWLHVCGLAYCNRNLTDGFIPRSAAHRLTSFEGVDVETEGVRGLVTTGCDVDCEWTAEVLCDHGIWDKVEGGYQIHDYLDYQPSRADVLALKETRTEAGRLGGKASGRARSKQVLDGLLEESLPFASSKREAKTNPDPVPVPKPEVLRSKSKPLAAAPQMRETAEKPKDLLWETLAHIFGESAEGLERDKWNAALKSLRSSGATPDSLRVAAAAWEQKFPGATMTAIGIARNWTTLAATPKTPAELERERQRQRFAALEGRETA